MGAEVLLIPLIVYTYEGIGFLKLANIVLILINPSPCYVKIYSDGQTFGVWTAEFSAHVSIRTGSLTIKSQ